MIQVLLNEGDYVGALELIEHAGKYLKGHQALVESQSDSPSDALPPFREIGPGVTLHRVGHIISKKIDLKGVKCLGTLSLQLTEVSRTIFSVMESDLIHILSKDLLQVLATPTSVPSIKEKDKLLIAPRISKAPASFWIKKILDNDFSLSTTTELMLPDEKLIVEDDALKIRLVPILLGLVRINRLDEALGAYKERLLQDIKILSKKVRDLDY